MLLIGLNNNEQNNITVTRLIYKIMFQRLMECDETIVKLTPCSDAIKLFNKSSAVAEVDDRGHSRHGPKRGKAAVPRSRGGEWVPV